MVEPYKGVSMAAAPDKPVESHGKGGNGARGANGARGWAAARQTLSLLLSLAAASAVLLFLLWSPFKAHEEDTSRDAAASADEVKVAGFGLLTIKSGSSLEKKLVVFEAAPKLIDAPLLTVTGYIVARLGPGKDTPEARWDFATPELAAAYSDWLKVGAEEKFAQKQSITVAELTKARVAAQTKVVDDLRDLVKIGSDAKKDLIAAEANLLQTRLQGQKDDFEAETAWKNATRNRVSLERQLFSAGVDPFVLEKKSELRAIVVAEVPEAKVDLVVAGQAVRAQFFAFKGTSFSGRVGSLAPTLNRERRTLRVFFEVDDPQARLKPGMFAEVGLGTDQRGVLLVPTEALLPLGSAAYGQAQAEPGTRRVTHVVAGEVHPWGTEILSGLAPHSKLIGSGAILLKPFLVKALQDR